MAVREEHEFELILGNRQLLSVLIIVILLLGFVFALGFLAGRSAGGARDALARAGARGPLVVDATPQTSSAPPVQPPAVRAGEDPAPPPAAGAGSGAQPPPAPPAGSAPFPGEAPPEPGTYLQVAATTRSQAANMLSLLAGKGFPVATAPAPQNPELFRVLVGPIPSAEDLARTRESLRGLGIDKPFIVKY
jgi:cell division septation protein DedD